MDTRSVVAAEYIDQAAWVVIRENLVFRAREGQDTSGQALTTVDKNEVCTVVLSQPWPFHSKAEPPRKIGLTSEFQHLGIVIKQHDNWCLTVENAPQMTVIRMLDNTAAVYVGYPCPPRPEIILDYAGSEDLAAKYWHWATTSYPIDYTDPTVQMMQSTHLDYGLQQRVPTKAKGLSCQ